MHCCTANGEFNRLRHCFNRRFRALQYSARCFYHPVMEKNSFGIEESRVRLGAPDIEADDHGRSSHNSKNIRIDCRCLATMRSFNVVVVCCLLWLATPNTSLLLPLLNFLSHRLGEGWNQIGSINSWADSTAFVSAVCVLIGLH